MEPLECKCKVGRCKVFEVCLECARCGCDHDGKSIERKTKRKSGGQGKQTAKRAKKGRLT